MGWRCSAVVLFSANLRSMPWRLMDSGFFFPIELSQRLWLELEPWDSAAFGDVLFERVAHNHPCTSSLVPRHGIIFLQQYLHTAIPYSRLNEAAMNGLRTPLTKTGHPRTSCHLSAASLKHSTDRTLLIGLVRAAPSSAVQIRFCNLFKIISIISLKV